MVKKYHRKQQYQEMSGILLLRVCMNSDRVNDVKSSCSLDTHLSAEYFLCQNLQALLLYNAKHFLLYDIS